jgi:hypothetical protein
VSPDEAPVLDMAVPLRNENGRPIVAKRLLLRAHAIAEALFLTADGPPPAERIAWLVNDLEDFLARAGERTRFVFGLAMFAVAFLAPLVSFRFTSLANMNVDERARVLERLENVFGPPVLAVKALLCVLYYEHPDAQRHIGFDGECMLEAPRGRELPMVP